ncbi:hypothetical protein M3Y95_00404800 [Aphelenchoides besseyi]|nr:hypothetical protein M3Y95_00404800 [Aphelenchoides besseyi]
MKIIVSFSFLLFILMLVSNPTTAAPQCNPSNFCKTFNIHDYGNDRFNTNKIVRYKTNCSFERSCLLSSEMKRLFALTFLVVAIIVLTGTVTAIEEKRKCDTRTYCEEKCNHKKICGHTEGCYVTCKPEECNCIAVA